MSPEQYTHFTEVLLDNARRDPNVLGVVLLGSAADANRRDDWSDHDMFWVVKSGLQEHYRQDLSWLPHPEQIVMRYRETQHGVNVIYDIGHLIEFAVFDLDELNVVKANDYAVPLDKADITQRMANAAGGTHPESVEAGVAVRHLMQIVFAGIGRWARGESISAHAFVRMYALRRLLQVLPLVLQPNNAHKLDSLDPYRRFEQVLPDLGAQIDALLRSDIPECAEGYLELLATHIKPHITDYPVDLEKTVRHHIQKARDYRANRTSR